MKVTDYVAEFLVRQGISTVFGYQGSSIAHMIDSLSKNPRICFVENRHEQAAAFSAVGYAQASGHLGAALACSGPGALNLLTGIADAYYDSIPVIFLTGQVSQKEMKVDVDLRQLGFQETSIVDIVRPITKYAKTVTRPEEIPYVLESAAQAALSGRPGPVLVDMPHNIQGANIKLSEIHAVPVNHDDASTRKTMIKEKDFVFLRQSLEHAKRPVFLLGGGCGRLASRIQDELHQSGIPIVVSYRGKNVYDNTVDNYCGVVGVYGDRSANWILRYSDCIISIGSRMDGRQTGGEIFQDEFNIDVFVIDLDSSELRKLPSCYHKIQADATEALEIIFSDGLHLQKEDIERWSACVHSWREQYPIEEEYPLQDGVNPNLFLKEISSQNRDKQLYTVDVGQNQLWTNASVDVGASQLLLQSAGLGAMGFALPAAIGASFASAREPVICITGDGGIQMNLQELQTISCYHVPVKIILLNNKSLGLIRDYQKKALHGNLIGSVEGFGSPDYEQIASAYGISYLSIKDNAQIKKANAELNSNRPCLIEVMISTDSIVSPEPTYGDTLLNQSQELPQEDLEKVKEQVKCLEPKR